MAVVIYGIKNCDSIKKAKKWLNDHAVEFVFHDYRQDGLSESLLNTLESALGWQQMVNKRGTTWRKLDDTVKESINQQSAVALMLDNPAIIKRPILDTGEALKLGFSANDYQEIFSI